ncbi:MAG: penicillin acylase family protein [Bacteroidota bacterium]|nr:penicillin acylase family protein [Candidatus Kapabacteria bacterium]MDW8219613.1 penicillin acylase family protein [Bacteroidota bacterium]
MALNFTRKRSTWISEPIISDARRLTFARRAPNHAWGIIVSGSVLSLLFCIFAIFTAVRSTFGRHGAEDVHGLGLEAQIYRNQYGIVHITAATDNDAYFALGYAHAQDRLWQMDFLRRVGRGQLSEIFGRSTLEHDIFMRAMRFDSIACSLLRSISPESRAVLEAYTRGVNAYITNHRGRLAVEFDALEYEPRLWHVEDCLLLLRLWAWELSTDFAADLVLSAIADTLGQEQALALLPYHSSLSSDVLCVLDSLGQQALSRAASPLVSPRPIPRPSTDVSPSDTSVSELPQPYHSTYRINSFSALGLHLCQTVQRMRTASQMYGSSLGSNAWAVRSSSFLDSPRIAQHHTFLTQYHHGALLTTDMHGALSAPARWYQAHLSSPTLNVLGFTLPGIPCMIIGRNDSISWSLVNAMVDDTDFFLEYIDSTDLRQYYRLNSTGNLTIERFHIATDTIKVKDSSNAVIDMRYTQRSCVLSDIPFGLRHYPGFKNAISWNSRLYSPSILHTLTDSTVLLQHPNVYKFLRKQCITLRWTGHYMSDEIHALLHISKAYSYNEARTAMQRFGTPAVNCVIACSDGSVGVFPTGFVPYRNTTPRATHPNFLRNGSERADEWQGVVHLSSVFAGVYNPSSGRVIAANNPIARSASLYNTPLHISYLWDTPLRAARIRECLESVEHYSVLEMQIIQNDVVSHYAQRITPYIIRAFASQTEATAQVLSPSYNLTFTEQYFLRLLASWNGALESTSAAASVYAAFLERYMHNTFADELGDHLYQQYCSITRLPLQVILALTQQYTPTDSSITWFDNRTTPQIESRDDIIRQSFREAVAALQQAFPLTEFTPDSAELWRYGLLHTASIRHVLSSGKQWTARSLQNVINFRPIEYGGDATTISLGEWSLNAPFSVTVGASLRFVCDMSDSVAYMILPSGNSGEVLTRNYADQHQLWHNGNMLPLSIRRTPHSSFDTVLVLRPKDETL